MLLAVVPNPAVSGGIELMAGVADEPSKGHSVLAIDKELQ